MKNLVPAALIAIALVLSSFLFAHAQQQPAAAAPAFDTFAVDTFAFAGSFTMGREIDQVYASTVAGEPFAKGRPERQQIGLTQLLAARGKQGYHLLSYFEGHGADFPTDAHYSSSNWSSNVRLVWGRKA